MGYSTTNRALLETRPLEIFFKGVVFQFKLGFDEVGFCLRIRPIIKNIEFFKKLDLLFFPLPEYLFSRHVTKKVVVGFYFLTSPVALEHLIEFKFWVLKINMKFTPTTRLYYPVIDLI